MRSRILNRSKRDKSYVVFNSNPKSASWASSYRRSIIKDMITDNYVEFSDNSKPMIHQGRRGRMNILKRVLKCIL